MSARMYTSLYIAFAAKVAATPTLARFKRQLTGSCCRPPLDVTLIANIRNFIAMNPQFAKDLGPLVEGK